MPGAVPFLAKRSYVASFIFKVIDERDQVVSGTLSAPTAQAAQERLRAVYKNVLVVEEQKSSASANALKRSPRVKIDSLAVYCRQLAVMVNRVAEEVEGGKSVSQALAEQPRVFNNIFIALVKAGETSGNLDVALKKLADLLEKVVGMQKKVQSTLAYPAVIFVVAVCVVAFFTFYIMPQMVPIFESMNTTLPLPTRIMMWLANTLRNPWVSGPLAVGAVVGSIMLFNLYQNLDKAPEVRYYVDQYLLRIPVVGQLFRLATQARVLFTMATLLDSGVSLAETLLVVEKVADNEVYSRRIKWSREALLQGASVYAAFESHEVFSPMALHMIKVGEETGTLAEMVRRIGQMYEEDVEHQLDQLSSLIEPLIMAVMGLIVGFITVASFLPMVQLINNL